MEQIVGSMRGLPRTSPNAVLSISINALTIARHLRPGPGVVEKNLASAKTSVAGLLHDLNAAGIFDICSRILINISSISEIRLYKIIHTNIPKPKMGDYSPCISLERRPHYIVHDIIARRKDLVVINKEPSKVRQDMFDEVSIDLAQE